MSILELINKNQRRKNTKFDALMFTKALVLDTEVVKKKPPYEPATKGLLFSEDSAQSSIIDYLLLQMVLGKLFIQRTNNTPVWDKDHYRSISKGQHKGFPDIIVIKGGRIIFFEVKSSIGKQKDDQAQMQLWVEAQGAEYYIVRTIDAVERALNQGALLSSS